LVRLQALKVSQDRFRSDSEPLITAVDQALKEARAERRKRGLTFTSKKMWLSVAGVVTLLALVVVAAILYFSSHPSKSPGAVAIPSPLISATPTKEEVTSKTLDKATKDHPWVNSLGMKFVPVADTQVLFSIWDTRV
jgi:hypothetical protein